MCPRKQHLEQIQMLFPNPTRLSAQVQQHACAGSECCLGTVIFGQVSGVHSSPSATRRILNLHQQDLRISRAAGPIEQKDCISILGFCPDYVCGNCRYGPGSLIVNFRNSSNTYMDFLYLVWDPGWGSAPPDTPFDAWTSENI